MDSGHRCFERNYPAQMHVNIYAYFTLIKFPVYKNTIWLKVNVFTFYAVQYCGLIYPPPPPPPSRTLHVTQTQSYRRRGKSIEIDTLEYQQAEKIETELKEVDRIRANRCTQLCPGSPSGASHSHNTIYQRWALDIFFIIRYRWFDNFLPVNRLR